MILISIRFRAGSAQADKVLGFGCESRGFLDPHTAGQLSPLGCETHSEK